ncbi:hypothetical protein [Streptomyces bacillaris]|uniref:hypothetical protein n=1 Tax=Streptomyces bacillaris TaxID=68179 RepID=UPI00365BA0D7
MATLTELAEHGVKVAEPVEDLPSAVALMGALPMPVGAVAEESTESVPVVVRRFDIAMEPAPEEEQVLTIGCVAEDGRPVALLLDLDDRPKVARWLALDEGTSMHDSVTGANLARWEEEQENARLRLALKAAQRGRRQLRARLEAFEALELGTPEGRISAKCDDSSHPVWLRDLDDMRGCPWCRVAELEAQRERRRSRLVALQNDALNMRGSLAPNGGERKVPFELGETLTPAVDWLINRVAELEAQAKPRGRERLAAKSVAEAEATHWKRLGVAPPEDPHDSPLHHSYALGRDLPEVTPTEEAERAAVDRSIIDQFPATAADKWNATHPVGTPVVAYPGFRPEDDSKCTRLVTRTRSAASVLGGHTAVVWVEGHSACISLTHVDPRLETGGAS